MLDLVPAAARGLDTTLNLDHFCLGIEADDLDQVVRHLRDHSIEVISEPALRYGARGMGRSIYVRDPEGNVVELKQMPAGVRT
jgi:glyoxylase I family protein